jgi:hypothetical protein
MLSRWLRGFSHRNLFFNSRLTQGRQRLEQRKTRRPNVEYLEDRCLPSITVGPNINISRELGNQNEATIAMNPTNPLNLWAMSNDENTALSGGLFGAVSFDGGGTWTRERIGTAVGGGTIPPACCDPEAFFDQNGNLFLMYLANTGGASLLLSSDGGVTFSLLNVFTDCIDQPNMAVGPTSVWVSYANATGGISASGATDTGLGAASIGLFSAPRELPGSTFGNFGSIAIGPSGQVIVVYQDSTVAVGQNTIFENINTTGIGGNWSFAIPVTITNIGADFGGFPQHTSPPTFLPATSNDLGIDAEANLAWDLSSGPHAGRVYMIYNNGPTISGPQVNLFERFSDDNGLTWSNPVEINDFHSTISSTFYPSIVVDPFTGIVAAQWYDSRNDLGQGEPNDTNGIVNDDAELFVSASFDGGVTWAPNVQVTPRASNARDSEPSAPGLRNLGYGDFELSTAFANGVYYPIWADNSNSTGDNPNGTLHKMNIYTAQIIISPGAGSSGGQGIVLGGSSGSGTSGGSSGTSSGGSTGSSGGPINIVLGSTRNSGANSFTNSFIGSASGSLRSSALTGDFAGTGSTEIATFNPSTGQWQVTMPNGGTSTWATWNPAAHWSNLMSGDFNGDGHTDIIGQEAGQWWVGTSTGSGFTTSLWSSWNGAINWVDAHVGNFAGSSMSDIVARPAGTGDWFVGTSTGSNFNTALWAQWSSAVTWVNVQVADFNGDGLPDISARVLQNGQWWTAVSTGSNFSTSLWGAWSSLVNWVDVKVGDFNGDGKMDIVGRVQSSGQWWVGTSDGGQFINGLFGTWNPSANWVDVQVGDFNGALNAATGLPIADITGRIAQSGQWWTGLSTGASFSTSLWDTWNPAVTWMDVQVGNFNGDAVIGLALQGGQWWMATPSQNSTATGSGTGTAGQGMSLGGTGTTTTSSGGFISPVMGGSGR